jgi:hypothetical protein
MRKTLIPALCVLLLGLPFSCSELILPKKIDIHGTLDLPIRVVADSWGSALATTLKKSFLGNLDRPDMIDFNTEVYDVNYGQVEQTFLISIQSEMTNHFNPAEYLEEAGKFLYRTGTAEPFNISYELDIGFFKEQEFPVLRQTLIAPDLSDGISLTIPKTLYDLDIEGFLHASIAEGDMKIMVELLDNGAILDNSFVDAIYTINIEQGENSYNHDGLSCSITSSIYSLNGKHINGEEIGINGSIVVRSKPNTAINLSSGELEVSITAKMTAQRLKEVDWDYSAITDQLNKHQLEPISLDDVSPYVNYILYDEKNIGLLFEFEEIIDGLSMSVGGNALGISGSQFQELIKGKKLIFANENAGTLWLAEANPLIPGYAPFGGKIANAFDFTLAFQPKNGGNVLHIEPAAGITPDTLKLKGKTEFFQNWIEAQLNLKKILNASSNNPGAIKKRIPGEGDEPIDFSLMSDYMSGFTFDGIQSEIYINGPNKAMAAMNNDSTLSFWAEYWQDDSNVPEILSIYNNARLTMDENSVSLGNNDFDANGSYKKRTLPPNGKPFDFSSIMNVQPKNLVFYYEIELPPVLTVTHDLFEDRTSHIDSKIMVTILIMLPLRLTVAENGPGIIKFPDMFGDKEDMFGRSNLEEDSIFKSLDMDYLKLGISFTGAFFNGGKLFLEKAGEEQLFRNGIILDGTTIALNIYGADFEIIKNNLINPDFRLVFENRGSTINVPRNMGLTNIKFETRGKFEL